MNGFQLPNKSDTGTSNASVNKALGVCRKWQYMKSRTAPIFISCFWTLKGWISLSSTRIYETSSEVKNGSGDVDFYDGAAIFKIERQASQCMPIWLPLKLKFNLLVPLIPRRNYFHCNTYAWPISICISKALPLIWYYIIAQSAISCIVFVAHTNQL